MDGRIPAFDGSVGSIQLGVTLVHDYKVQMREYKWSQ